MAETQRFAERDVVARQYQYADGDVLAFDLGAGTTGAVDVVDGTLLVVVDDDQFEMDLPDGRPAQATINNGVVTVEMHGATADVDGETVDVDAPGGENEAADTEDDR
ncbi:hypothetical protein [Haloglomus litoreum]|uniref:hypothetical protein n=1 Tax=Haloglomus litoreum TaxID=3034026 RepID=UPI0023E81DCB|nr:hypothetical protein [Haloglomus sp. DT116]